MFRKSFFGLAAVAVLVFASGMTAYAQIAITSGTVELVQADGTRVPVANANIDVYRTDSKAGFPKGKTDKRGGFNFAGFVIGGVYALAVSAPNCTPTIFPGIKAGQEKILISMRPGDGKQFTETEVREAIARGGKAGPAGDAAPDTSSADKAAADKAKAEYDAKVAEINAKKAKMDENYDKINALLKEGGTAFDAKNFTLAIAKFDEAIALEPDFAGSTPTMLANRGLALRKRAIDKHNESIKMTDDIAKSEANAAVKKDFLDSANSYLRSWEIMKNAPADAVKDQTVIVTNKARTLKESFETFNDSVRARRVDAEMVEAAKVLLPEYLAAETDAAKKSQGTILLAYLYREAGDKESAVAEFKKVLTADPTNQRAMQDAGYEMINLAYEKSDDGMMQEAADLLQKYVAIAPEGADKKAAQEAIDALKKDKNITTQKPTGGGKKKP